MPSHRPLVLAAALGLAALAASLTATPAAAMTVTESAGLAPSARSAVPAAHATHPRPHRRSKAIMPTRARAALRPGTTSAPMTYHGGRLMTAPAHVHLIWYGAWSGSRAVPVLSDAIRGLGGSAYAGTNATFTDRTGHHVTSDVSLGGSVDDRYSHGRVLGDGSVKAVVRAAITAGRLPLDKDGIYVVLTSADVRESSGFGTRYCGWHSHATLRRTDITYVFAGDPTLQAPRGCVAPMSPTPSGDANVDALVSTVVHEIDETLTDPDLDGWYDRWFNENADKCAWTFGPVRRTASGGWTDLSLGGRDLLVQRNWAVAPTQGCTMGG